MKIQDVVDVQGYSFIFSESDLSEENKSLALYMSIGWVIKQIVFDPSLNKLAYLIEKEVE